MAAAVAFLASDAGQYITGETIHVNGGFTWVNLRHQGCNSGRKGFYLVQKLVKSAASGEMSRHTTESKDYVMSNIEDRVRKIVAEQLGVKEEEVKAEASFVDDLGADSLDTVELVMALEEEFETEIPDEEAEKITTVQLAIDYINNNLS